MFSGDKNINLIKFNRKGFHIFLAIKFLTSECILNTRINWTSKFWIETQDLGKESRNALPGFLYVKEIWIHSPLMSLTRYVISHKSFSILEAQSSEDENAHLIWFIEKIK